MELVQAIEMREQIKQLQILEKAEKFEATVSGNNEARHLEIIRASGNLRKTQQNRFLVEEKPPPITFAPRPVPQPPIQIAPPRPRGLTYDLTTALCILAGSYQDSYPLVEQAARRKLQYQRSTELVFTDPVMLMTDTLPEKKPTYRRRIMRGGRVCIEKEPEEMDNYAWGRYVTSTGGHVNPYCQGIGFGEEEDTDIDSFKRLRKLIAAGFRSYKQRR